MSPQTTKAKEKAVACMATFLLSILLYLIIMAVFLAIPGFIAWNFNLNISTWIPEARFVFVVFSLITFVPTIAFFATAMSIIDPV
jgi:hypothetical protein